MEGSLAYSTGLSIVRAGVQRFHLHYVQCVCELKTPAEEQAPALFNLHYMYRGPTYDSLCRLGVEGSLSVNELTHHNFPMKLNGKGKFG